MRSAGFSFVADGYGRLRSAAAQEIRAKFAVEYAEQLAAAGFWRRLWLWHVIEREVQLRLDNVAPPGACY